METIAPKPSDFPEMDATLVKCIAYMQVGGKESRRSLKEMIENLNLDEIVVVIQPNYIKVSQRVYGCNSRQWYRLSAHYI